MRTMTPKSVKEKSTASRSTSDAENEVSLHEETNQPQNTKIVSSSDAITQIGLDKMMPEMNKKLIES